MSTYTLLHNDYAVKVNISQRVRRGADVLTIESESWQAQYTVYVLRGLTPSANATCLLFKSHLQVSSNPPFDSLPQYQKERSPHRL